MLNHGGFMISRHKVFYSFLAGLTMMVTSFSTFSADSSNIFSYRVGDMTISLLSEMQSEGNESILLNATPEQISQYMPTKTFPMAVNAFLLQTPEKRILVDTGFGTKLFNNLQLLNIAPEQIDVILLTHLHSDHIGGLIKDGKQAFPNATLYVSEQEKDYWTDEKVMAQQPDQRQASFKQAQDALKIYGKQLKTFKPNKLAEQTSLLLPGVTAVEAFGHTPGHTAFLLQSNEERLLIWGDLTHAMAIQIPAPDVAVIYDVDPKTAVATRKAILNYATQNGIPVAGMHIAYPAIGRINVDSNQIYHYTPLAN
jgi:glyoxylase-like metal-dependent hydrolase (beta-lactamase superfamily II)